MGRYSCSDSQIVNLRIDDLQCVQKSVSHLILIYMRSQIMARMENAPYSQELNIPDYQESHYTYMKVHSQGRQCLKDHYSNHSP